MSTTYNPKTDGQTELINRCIQQYLQSFVHEKPSDWVRYLHWAKWCYNTTSHSATRLSPFQVVYGKLPSNIPTYISSTKEAVDYTLKTRDEILEILNPTSPKLKKYEINCKQKEIKFTLCYRRLGLS